MPRLGMMRTKLRPGEARPPMQRKRLRARQPQVLAFRATIHVVA